MDWTGLQQRRNCFQIVLPGVVKRILRPYQSGWRRTRAIARWGYWRDFSPIYKYVSCSYISFVHSFKQQAYYYSHFKGTSDYRNMKRGAAKKRQMRTRSSVGSDDSTCSDECVRCHDVGELIYCDICMRTFHLYCTTPKLESVPPGNWYCGDCDSNMGWIFFVAADSVWLST